MSAPERLEVTLPRDPSGFVRRQCPACLRIFKTRPSRFDSRSVHRRLVMLFPFENPHEGYEPVPTWTCFYCGHRAEADEWLVRDHVAYLEELARGLANHVRYEQLAHISRTLSQNPRPTFVAVAPEPLPEGMPLEEEDLRALHLVCCDEEVKALWDWDGPFYCPRCGAHHAGPTGRQVLQLEFIQE
ncbi:MAG: hypothetical protein JXB05_35160 [Myxococcaceae bacterium]|nr:hypothetical protein [Myxococcaceae bacterium]